MLSFFRDGFYQDVIILLILTIIIGSVFSQGVAWAIDTYFGDTLDDMIGEYGEYDLILHIREEAKEAAMRELERIGEESFPGFKLNQTFTIAGQANIFFGLPKAQRTKEVLESIASYFGAVPGLNGYTLMVEPSVLIRGVHPGVRQELRELISEVNGVGFVVQDGNNLIAVIDAEDTVSRVSKDIDVILANYEILELRFPMGFEVDTGEVGQQALDILRAHYPMIEGDYTNITSAEYGEDLDAFLKTLMEMRAFLAGYASKVTIIGAEGAHLGVGELLVLVSKEDFVDDLVVEITEVTPINVKGMIVKGSPVQSMDKLVLPAYRWEGESGRGELIGDGEIENERYRLAYAIDESLRLLEELEELSVQANEAVSNADAVLTTFQEALMQLEVLQVQMRQLNEGISKGDAKASGEQFLVSLLLNGLFQTLAQAAINTGEGSLDSLESLDIEEMRRSLNGISTQIANVQGIDLTAIIEQISHVRNTLPDLRDEEIGQSIRLINTYLGGQVIPGERIQILVQGKKFDEKGLEKLFRDKLDNPLVHIYFTSVGMINPDPRGEIFRILKEVRSIVAGLLSIVFTLIVLILDHATIFSTLKYVRSTKTPIKKWWMKVFDPLLVTGGIVGSLILTCVFKLSRAQVPFFSLPVIVLVGFSLGMLVVVFAERFSPINSMEVMAGQSLGLSNVQIMREILIPSSRPGLLNLQNRWKQKF